MRASPQQHSNSTCGRHTLCATDWRLPRVHLARGRSHFIRINATSAHRRARTQSSRCAWAQARHPYRRKPAPCCARTRIRPTNPLCVCGARSLDDMIVADKVGMHRRINDGGRRLRFGCRSFGAVCAHTGSRTTAMGNGFAEWGGIRCTVLAF